MQFKWEMKVSNIPPEKYGCKAEI